MKQPEDRRPKEPTLAEAAAQLDRRRRAQINRQIEIIDRLLTGDGYDEILRSQTEEIAKLRLRLADLVPVEEACEVMHDAYERAAIGAGWETQAASRKPWADVPEANKITMRAAVGALLDRIRDDA